MIPTLHYLEICLRNRIDQVFKKHRAPNWLVNPTRPLIISEQDTKKINEVIAKILRETKREATHDDIVSQMTFGFWCSFLHRRYDPIIWHRKDTFKIIFPNLPRAPYYPTRRGKRAFVRIRGRVSRVDRMSSVIQSKPYLKKLN